MLQMTNIIARLMLEEVRTISKSLTEIMLEQHGTKGMKWGIRRFRDRFGKRKQRHTLEEINRSLHKGVNEREREKAFIKEYKNRDKMSTAAIRARTNRLNAEADFERAVYAKERARNAAALAEKQKHAQMRRLIVGVSLDTVSAMPVQRMMAKYNIETYGKKAGEKRTEANADKYDMIQNGMKAFAKYYSQYAKLQNGTAGGKN